IQHARHLIMNMNDPGKANEKVLDMQKGVLRPSYLFITPWELRYAGGVTIVVKNLAKAMRERGALEPLVAINSWEHTSPALLDDETLRFRFNLLGGVSALGLLKGIITAPTILWRTSRLLRKYNVQAVNFHFPGIAPLGVA